MTLVGRVPPSGLSVRFGRADVIIEKLGEIYCEHCCRETYGHEQDRAPFCLSFEVFPT